MDKPITVELNDIGIVDGFQTFEVINTDTGETIGYNQTMPAEEII